MYVTDNFLNGMYVNDSIYTSLTLPPGAPLRSSCVELLRPGFAKSRKTESVTAVTGLTELARLLKRTGFAPLTVPTKLSFSANRSV
jgi:hypothetical protein